MKGVDSVNKYDPSRKCVGTSRDVEASMAVEGSPSDISVGSERVAAA